MELLKTIIAFVVIALVATEAVRTLYTSRRSSDEMYVRMSHLLWRRARQLGVVRVAAANAPVRAGVVLAAYVLSFVPGLSWGWWSLLGGTGNIAVGSTGSFGDWGSPLVALVMCALFVAVAPVYVSFEEWTFRRHSESRSVPRQLAVAFGFGMLHLVAGIPVAAAIALTGAGWWFTNRYLAGHRLESHPVADDLADRGTLEHRQLAGALDAGSYHLVWNVSLVAVFAAFTAYGLVADLVAHLRA